MVLMPLNPHRGSGKMMMFCIDVVYCFNVSPKFSKEKLDEGLFCFVAPQSPQGKWEDEVVLC
jgi:hypothetical protein